MKHLETVHIPGTTHSFRLYYDKSWEEYIIKFYYNGVYLKDSDYFTNDLDDALSTGNFQIKSW